MKIIVKKIPKINKKNLKIKLVISEISNKFQFKYFRNFRKKIRKISFKIDKNE